MGVDVSVIMAAYNSAEFIVDAIESVLNQSEAPHELLVIDDGSTDDTVSLVKSTFPTVHIQTAAHRGISAVYNSGIELASAEWIAFLDADDLWLNEKLTRQSLLQKATGADFVFCQKCSFDHRTGEHVDSPRYRSDMCADPLRSLLDRFFASPSTAFVRKRVLVEAGMFDAAFATSEDYDLWIRVAALGARFALLDEELVLKRVHGGSAQRSAGWSRLAQDVGRALCKNRNLFALGLSIPRWQVSMRIGASLAEFLHRNAARGGGRDILRCYLCALASGPMAFATAVCATVWPRLSVWNSPDKRERLS